VHSKEGGGRNGTGNELLLAARIRAFSSTIRVLQEGGNAGGSPQAHRAQSAGLEVQGGRQSSDMKSTYSDMKTT
jgi:hypothetical protein